MAADQVRALKWGVKESFRSYVENAGGSIAVSEGATRDGDGAFVFPASGDGGLAIGADGRPDGAGAFEGEVRFEAHGGMLKVAFAAPSLEVVEGGASITVAGAVGGRRVQLADLDLAQATTDAEALVIPAKLAKDGWRILGDHYGPATPLDPVRLILRRP